MLVYKLGSTPSVPGIFLMIAAPIGHNTIHFNHLKLIELIYERNTVGVVVKHQSIIVRLTKLFAQTTWKWWCTMSPSLLSGRRFSSCVNFHWSRQTASCWLHSFILHRRVRPFITQTRRLFRPIRYRGSAIALVCLADDHSSFAMYFLYIYCSW